MKKILFCASTISHIRNFHLPYVKTFHEKGYEVWVAANKAEEIPYVNHAMAFPFTKSILSFYNIISVFKLRKLLMREKFDKISTNSALASIILRLAILLMPKSMRPCVYYIVHGFLFHRNDSLKKWLYLLPEIICSPVTNVLMVMNQEDLEIASKYSLYKDKLCFINGIGIDLSSFDPVSPEQRKEGRQLLGLSTEDFMFIYAAEFSKRKNQESLIRSFTEVSSKIPQAHLLLAGDGALYNKCLSLVNKLNMQNKIHFLGYVNKMYDLYPLCDAAVSSSKSEGIPFNIMEAMACGLPILLSDVKGHRDLVENKKEFLFHTKQELSSKIYQYVSQPSHPPDWSSNIEKYSIEQVAGQLMELYGESSF